MKHILIFLAVISISTASFSQTNSTDQQILMSSKWLLQGVENSYHILDFSNNEACLDVDNTVIFVGAYYFSDEADSFFDYSKIDSNETGSYLVILTNESNDAFVVMEIISIDSTTLVLKNVEKTFNLEYSAIPK